MSDFDALGDEYERTAVEMPFREHVENHSMRQAVGDIAGLAVLDLGAPSIEVSEQPGREFPPTRKNDIIAFPEIYCPFFSVIHPDSLNMEMYLIRWSHRFGLTRSTMAVDRFHDIQFGDFAARAYAVSRSVTPRSTAVLSRALGCYSVVIGGGFPGWPVLIGLR